MRPDEAVGLIFNWDNVVANTRELQRRAWRRVAKAEGLPFPAMERPQLYDVRPERAVTDVSGRAQPGTAWGVATGRAHSRLFGSHHLPGCRQPRCRGLGPTPRAPSAPPQVLMWTRDWKRAQELAWLVATEYARLLLELAEPLDGVEDWLQARFPPKVGGRGGEM